MKFLSQLLTMILRLVYWLFFLCTL